MKLWKFTQVIVSILCCTQSLFAQGSYKENVEKYINTYKDLAIEEQQRSGIPAAITLAQGVHETSAGMSELALNAKNHFGIKCKKSWTGATYTYTDDAPNECFRKYDNVLDSYKDHTDYLKNSPRYNSLFELSITDYAAWASGLKRCGYATNPKYAQMLIKIIEDYHLQQYTYAAMNGDKPQPIPDKVAQNKAIETLPKEIIPVEDAQPKRVTKERKSGMVVEENSSEEQVIKNNDKPPFGQLVRVNGLKAFYAKKGSSLLGDAIKFNIRYAKLLELNDLKDEPLEADMFIYTEKKHSKGNTALHVVKPGESLLQAAQYEGIQLRYLKYYNKLSNNEQPAAGALLYLQEVANEKPDLAKSENDAAKVVDVSQRFAGDSPGAVPQGSTRMRAGYISKKQIEEAGKDKTIETTKPVVARVDTTIQQKQVNTEPKTVEPVVAPEKHLASDAMATDEEKKIAIEATKQKAAADSTTKNTAPPPPPVAEVKKEEIEAPATPAAPVEKEVVKTIKDTAEATKPQQAIETKKEELVQQTKDTITNIAKATEPVPVKKDTVQEVAATPPPPPEPEKPKDEFDMLKAKLDRVVYASEKSTDKTKTKPAATETKKEEAKTTQKELKPQPKPTPGSAKAEAGFVGLYTVKKGDTAFSIAKKNKISIKQLMEWNNLTDFKEVKVGQQLRVK